MTSSLRTKNTGGLLNQRKNCYNDHIVFGGRLWWYCSRSTTHNGDVFFFPRMWPLYPSGLGQATQPAFGLYASAETKSARSDKEHERARLWMIENHKVRDRKFSRYWMFLKILRMSPSAAYSGPMRFEAFVCELMFAFSRRRRIMRGGGTYVRKKGVAHLTRPTALIRRLLMLESFEEHVTGQIRLVNAEGDFPVLAERLLRVEEC